MFPGNAPVLVRNLIDHVTHCMNTTRNMSIEHEFPLPRAALNGVKLYVCISRLSFIFKRPYFNVDTRLNFDVRLPYMRKQNELKKKYLNKTGCQIICLFCTQGA